MEKSPPVNICRKADMMDIFSLKDKTVFLSGSYRGLGFSIAEALGKVGAKVILNGRSSDGIALSVKKLEEKGIRVRGYAFDITRQEEVSENIRKILCENGPVDVLVNNAGIQRRGNLEVLPLEYWQESMDLNLTAAFMLSQQFVNGMIERKTGKIINICSLMSSITRPTTGAYTASKGALLMLTKSMAVEWAQYNIQANAIAPGYFHTEMTDSLVRDEKFNAWISGRTPARRWGKPEDLGGLAIFLASHASDFINGQCIYVDGGLSAAI